MQRIWISHSPLFSLSGLLISFQIKLLSMPHFGIALNKYYWVHITDWALFTHFSFRPHNNPRKLVSFSSKGTDTRWLAQRNQGWTQVWQSPNFNRLPIQRADLHMEQSSHHACKFPLAFLQDQKLISSKPGWLIINLEEMCTLKCPQRTMFFAIKRDGHLISLLPSLQLLPTSKEVWAPVMCL